MLPAVHSGVLELDDRKIQIHSSLKLPVVDRLLMQDTIQIVRSTSAQTMATSLALVLSACFPRGYFLLAIARSIIMED